MLTERMGLRHMALCEKSHWATHNSISLLCTFFIVLPLYVILALLVEGLSGKSKRIMSSAQDNSPLKRDINLLNSRYI